MVGGVLLAVRYGIARKRFDGEMLRICYISPFPFFCFFCIKTPMRKFFLALAAVLISFVGSEKAQSALIMKVDTNNQSFYFQGSDQGSAYKMDFFFSEDYSLQFIHFFPSTAVYASLTENPENFFVEGATLSINGKMSMTRNGNENYLFLDLSSSRSDITTLTGTGQSASVSYANLTSSNIILFESLIGGSLTQSIGTGYSPISVQAVPEPSTYALFGLGAIGMLMVMRRNKEN